ncbi:hypothetical protein [Nocardioides campestrisoli]|uniref:hypothetical protein n=1 Tax=Nocardioides campestrisoli TaxID=2736757 RepID=UPI0015E7B089|nr:hypothetical protein [Nocardioides campestrisoli]
MTSPQTSTPTRTSSYAARLGVAALVLALVAAGMWFAWLGWDQEYYLVDGERQGPYRPWQVIGCGASIAVASVLALLWVRAAGPDRRGGGAAAAVALSPAAVFGFAVPWTAEAASSDDSGLWVVGLLMLLVGGWLGLTMLLAVTAAVARRR